ESSLAPLRWKMLRSGRPQTLQFQLYNLRRESPTSAAAGASRPVPWSGGASLLPWKAGMQLLPRADFKEAVGKDRLQQTMLKTSNNNNSNNSNNNNSNNNNKSRSLPSTSTGPGILGAEFLKWGRNGKPKKRYVEFDQILMAIVWKNTAEDASPVGVISLASIQDICVGVQTPLLLNVQSAKHPHLQAALTWSVVAAERTLDLQADSVDQQKEWVLGLRLAYRQLTASQLQKGFSSPMIPKAWEAKQKAYPEKFRSNLCELRSACAKLQADGALGVFKHV
ncbi:unnamed protein product, partial [Polarella glacialis]